MNWWQRLKTFLHEVVVETKKVTFPSRDEVVATTVVVIAASFVFGIFLYLCDLVFFRLVDWVIKSLSGG
jgi:preprotein translocase subunit SecE